MLINEETTAISDLDEIEETGHVETDSETTPISALNEIEETGHVATDSETTSISDLDEIEETGHVGTDSDTDLENSVKLIMPVSEYKITKEHESSSIWNTNFTSISSSISSITFTHTSHFDGPEMISILSSTFINTSHLEMIQESILNSTNTFTNMLFLDFISIFGESEMVKEHSSISSDIITKFMNITSESVSESKIIKEHAISSTSMTFPYPISPYICTHHTNESFMLSIGDEHTNNAH